MIHCAAVDHYAVVDRCAVADRCAAVELIVALPIWAVDRRVVADRSAAAVVPVVPAARNAESVVQSVVLIVVQI